MKLSTFIILTLVFWGCQRHTSQIQKMNNIGIKDIPILELTQPILYAMLDSVVKIQHKCHNYNDSIPFGVTEFHGEFGFQPALHLESSLNYSDYIGGLKYKQHLFLFGLLNKVWYHKINNYIYLHYKINKNTPTYPPNDNETVFQINRNKIVLIREIQCE